MIKKGYRNRSFQIFLILISSLIFLTSGFISCFNNNGDNFGNVALDGDDIYVLGRHSSPGDFFRYNYNLIKFDSNGNEVWSRTVEQGWAGEQGVGGIVAENGAIYITGDGGDGSNGPQAFLIKYNSYGNEIWRRTWGGSTPGSGWGTDVAVNITNIYFTGTKAGRAFLVKFDSNGNKLWNRTFSSTYSGGFGITVEGNDVYLAGYSGVSASFTNILLVRYDADGNQIWNRTRSYSSIDEARDVAVVGDDVYLAGTVYYGGNQRDVLLVKYNSSGDFLWDETWGGALEESGESLAVDTFGNIYVGGYAYSYGQRDTMLTKFNSSGSQVWMRTWSGSDACEGADIVIDDNNNIIMVGWAEDGLPKISDWDGLLIKYDGAGTELWSQTWGTEGIGRYILMIVGIIGAAIGISMMVVSRIYGRKDKKLQVLKAQEQKLDHILNKLVELKKLDVETIKSVMNEVDYQELIETRSFRSMKVLLKNLIQRDIIEWKEVEKISPEREDLEGLKDDLIGV